MSTYKRCWIFLLLFILVSCKTTLTPTQPEIPLSGLAGLRADYFASDNFSGPKMTQIDRQVFFDWGTIAPVKSFAPGKFSVRWQANLRIESSASYKFYLTHSGQASLKIAGQSVSLGSSLYLKEGQYPLVLEFRKTQNVAAVKLEWLKDAKREVLPQAVLTPTAVSHQEISMAVTRDTNLLLNSDFSSGSAAWLSYGGQTRVLAPGQDGTGQALGISSWAWVQQDLPVSSVEVGETYTLSASVLAGSGMTCTLGIAGGSTTQTLFRKTLSYRESFWQRQVVSLVLPINTVWTAVYMTSTQPECQFDDLSLVAGLSAPPTLPKEEVVLNGGFEEQFEAWGRYGGNANITSPGFEGSRALQISNFAWVQQDFPASLLESGQDYVLSAYGRSISGGVCTLGLTLAGDVLSSQSLEFTSNTWELQALTLSVPNQVTWAAIYLASPAAACEFDQVSLRFGSSLALDNVLQPLLLRNGATSIVPDPRPAAAKVQLGQMLMHDKLLSGNKDISCATCHSTTLKTGDGRSLAIGVDGQGLGPNRQLGVGKTFIPRHAPELFNRGVSQWRNFFWDGRLNKTATGFSAPNITFPAGVENLLAAQAMTVVLSRTEMRGQAGDLDINSQPNELAIIDNNPEAVWDGLMTRLLAIEGYRNLFAAAYPSIPLDQLGFEHAANAIAAFEIDAWTLLNSPFDQYLAGQRQALPDQAKRGAILFYGQAKCSVCHSGALLSDQQTHNIGIPQLGPGIPGSEPLDLGRFRLSGSTLDRYAFRTPPLRNTAVTGPWMHNGAFTTLEQVVRHYDNIQTSLESYTGQNLPADLRSTVQTSPEVKNDILATLDGNVFLPLNLSETQVSEMVSFLEALTDPRVNSLEQTIPASVPSGLPIDR